MGVRFTDYKIDPCSLYWMGFLRSGTNFNFLLGFCFVLLELLIDSLFSLYNRDMCFISCSLTYSDVSFCVFKAIAFISSYKFFRFSKTNWVGCYSTVYIYKTGGIRLFLNQNMPLTHVLLVHTFLFKRI